MSRVVVAASRVFGLDSSVLLTDQLLQVLFSGNEVEEIKKLLADRSGFAQCGPCISGVKCRMLRDNMDDEGIFTLNLKTASDAEGNTYSVSVGKTLQTLVIGKGKKDANGGQVASKVFATVEHLRKANY